MDILNWRTKMADLEVRIPESVKVSIFTVIIKDIRNKYCGTYQSIIDKEIKLIAAMAIDMTREVNMKFEEINDAICREPVDIEDLYEIKKFMVDSGVTIGKLKKKIDATMRSYEIATEFQHEFSNADNDRKWLLYGAPLRTKALMEEQVLVLEKQKEAFLKEMESEQEQFNDTLELLENSVKTFAGNFNKIEEYESAAAAVESVNQRLQSCIDEAKTYNLRESLSGAPITDYSHLQKMVKEFQPLSNLWTTARTWY
jgi:dynein heavy chain, axonemal